MTDSKPLFVFLALAFASIDARADALPEDDSPPVVKITKPAARTELPAGTTKTTIEVSAEDKETGVVEVRLLVDDKVVKTIDEEPWVFADVELTPGEHTIAVEAVNADVDEEKSDPITIVVAAAAPPPPPEPPPTEVKADAKAQPVADTKATPALEAKTPTTKPVAASAEAKADAKAEAKDGCFASARPRSLVGSGLAFAIAVLAGLMLRRRA